MAIPPPLIAESESLVASWQQHDGAMLGDYLIQGVEDPRLNVQSILTRHFLAFATFGDRFEPLAHAELGFAAVMNWLLRLRETGDLDAELIAYALERAAENCEGIQIPAFLSRTHAELPSVAARLGIQTYLHDFLERERSSTPPSGWPPPELNTFQNAWSHAVPNPPQRTGGFSVLEAACGSANDYRFLHAYGLASHVRYTGFDLCKKNVENARSSFPDACFEVANVFGLPYPDASFDYCFAHDLFEHLSLEGFERAASELARVTRQGLCLHFFQMAENPDHVVRPVDSYHWNLLSVDRTREMFDTLGFDSQVMHVGSFLRERTGCAETHNLDAYTMILARR